MLTQALKGTEDQSKKTAAAVQNVGKGGGAGLTALKNDLSGVDKAFGGLSGVLSGGLGRRGGACRAGRNCGGNRADYGSAINEAVLAAERVDKLKF